MAILVNILLRVESMAQAHRTHDHNENEKEAVLPNGSSQNILEGVKTKSSEMVVPSLPIALR
jgi:hypothetical protein